MDADYLSHWLLEQEPSLVLQWLREMVEGTRPLPTGFNWHGLAECAASDANDRRKSDKPPFPNLHWANVAVFAYNYVLHEEKNSSRLAHKPEMKKFSYLSLERALMRVHAHCILTCGSVAGDPVLDVNHLIELFFEDIPFSPDEAHEKCVVGKAFLLPEERRELVRIRLKLEILHSRPFP